MGLVTAVSWTIAALAGAYLLLSWLPRGRQRRDARRAKVTRFPGALVVGHPALAVAAFACWAGGLLTGSRALAWTAFGALAVAALLGFAMSTRWLGAGRHGNAVRGFPVLAVALHGLAGVATFTLLLLAASAF
ncbi:hypothetical protein SAMN05421874_113142 [Nonomuraea maritima]|uniref:DUF4079 domain-containing protein n=1 Tax=Nonomuraea maritima TaxID=683260 RepID=A0A1G9G4N1_9ACTN|nr:hypothetical protein [Nonomuraea maritima]SDK95576.1 hypothetical protein SAMN05421874_113142 [Nonomuraea maritima]